MQLNKYLYLTVILVSPLTELIICRYAHCVMASDRSSSITSPADTSPPLHTIHVPPLPPVLNLSLHMLMQVEISGGYYLLVLSRKF